MKRDFQFLVIAFMFLSLAGCTKNTAEKQMEYGAKCFQQGNFDCAIEKYSKAIELDPKSAIAFNLLGMAYRFKYNQTRNVDYKNKEIESFKKSIELDPTYWGAMINLAATYYYNNQKELAVPLLKKALELNPDNPEKEQLMKMIAQSESGTSE